MSVYVVSVGMTKVGRHFDKGFKELSIEALENALNNAELSLNDIDYLVVSSAFSESLIYQNDPATMLAQELGLRTVRTLRIESGETSGAVALEVAYSLIKSGQAERVAVVGFEKLSEFPSVRANTVYSRTLDYEVEVLRNISPVNYAALIMKEYMRKYGIDRDSILTWSVKMHENASNNQFAQLPFKITLEKARKGMIVSDPITLFDSFPLGDGAAAVVLTNRAHAENAPNEPVEIAAIEGSVGSPLYLRDNIAELPATKEAVKRILSKHELKIDENIAIQVHDSYSIYGLLALEAIGIAEPGKAAEAINRMEYVNVGGGLKARGHPVGATPIYQLSETYLLLTEGFAGKKYDGNVGLIHSMSGPDYNSRIILLRRWA